MIVQNLLSSILPAWIQLSKEKARQSLNALHQNKIHIQFFSLQPIQVRFIKLVYCLNEISHLLGGAAQESSVVLRLCTIS